MKQIIFAMTICIKIFDLIAHCSNDGNLSTDLGTYSRQDLKGNKSNLDN